MLAHPSPAAPFRPGEGVLQHCACTSSTHLSVGASSELIRPPPYLQAISWYSVVPAHRLRMSTAVHLEVYVRAL